MSTSYEIGTLFAASGTAALNSTAAVVGSSTAFLSQFSPGYLIVIAGETRVVETVSDNTHLTVADAFAGSSSGNSISGVNLKNLKSLSTPVDYPKHVYSPGSDYKELGNGGLRLLGSPQATWRWGILRRTTSAQAQRDMLRTFCTGASAAVVIRTRVSDNADEYKYFSCQVLWPQGAEDKDAGRRVGFELRFTAMAELDVS